MIPNPVFRIITVLGILLASSEIGTAQPVESWLGFADSLYDNLILIDSEVMTAAENSFLEAHELGDCTAQIRAGLVVLRGVAIGISSRIFPYFLEDIEACDDVHSAHWTLFKWNAIDGLIEWDRALNEPFDGAQMTVWNNYVQWEREHQGLIATFESRETNKLNDAILTLEQTIAQLRQEKQELLRLNWAWAITTLLLLMAYLVYRIQVQKKRIAFMERALRKPVPASTVALPLKNEDVRTLTEAISKGTRISDASQVIRKLQVLLNQGNESKSISVSKKARFNDLNDSEKAVADYLANGLGAKEIARVMKVSTAYVYNVRSRIRIKLNIPDDINLNSWLRDIASGKIV